MRESLALARAGIGLAQGLAIYFLYYSSEAKTWPANDGAPLLLVSVFVPIIAWPRQTICARAASPVGSSLPQWC
jgi:hypothetical protein